MEDHGIAVTDKTIEDGPLVMHPIAQFRVSVIFLAR